MREPRWGGEPGPAGPGPREGQGKERKPRALAAARRAPGAKTSASPRGPSPRLLPPPGSAHRAGLPAAITAPPRLRGRDTGGSSPAGQLEPGRGKAAATPARPVRLRRCRPHGRISRALRGAAEGRGRGWIPLAQGCCRPWAPARAGPGSAPEAAGAMLASAPRACPG